MGEAGNISQRPAGCCGDLTALQDKAPNRQEARPPEARSVEVLLSVLKPSLITFISKTWKPQSA